MFDEKIQKLSFRCENCKTILISDFDDEEDINDAKEGILYFECPCGGKSRLLTN